MEGEIVEFSANVSLEVTKLVGELDREEDSVELQDVTLIVGKSVMLQSIYVGLGDISIVGAVVFCAMVGDIVALLVKVELEVAKLVGELDCDDDTEEL